jgi:hypothetical protein
MQPKENRQDKQQPTEQQDGDVEKGTGTGRDPQTENPGSRGGQKKSNHGDKQEEQPEEDVPSEQGEQEQE